MENSLIEAFNKISKEKKNKLIEKLIFKHSKLERYKKENVELLENISRVENIFRSTSKDILVEFTLVKETFLQSLVEKSKYKSLTKWERDVLGSIINIEFETLMGINCMSDKSEKLMQDYQKTVLEKMSASDKKEAEELLKNLKSEMNLPFDVDLSRITDAEYIKKLQREMYEKSFEDEKVERENGFFENEQNVNIDFKKIYKKMARFSHPDLAKTEKERVEKEVLFKRINEAWAAADYYELIIIWMDADPDNQLNIELSEKNCKDILSQLDLLINKAEAEKYNIKVFNPQTSYYFKNFYAKREKTILKKIDDFLSTIKKEIEITNYKIIDVKTLAGLKRALAMVYDQYDEEEDLFYIDEEMMKELFNKMKK